MSVKDTRYKPGKSVRELFVPRIIPVNSRSVELSVETQAVIRALHRYLRRAEAGKIHGMCFTSANNDQTYDIESAGSYEKYPSEAIGPLEVLKLKLTRKALDEH
jgi:hypothetical protein